MNRMYVLAGALALAVVVTASVQAEDDKDKKDGKVPSIKKIMQATHSKTGFRAKYQQAVKGGDWEKAEKIAKDWLTCAENLAKNEPPKGEKQDWEKMAKNYTKAVKNIEEASGKKDAEQVKDSLGFIGKSCGTCHKAHKP
jgi:cytochrome c556